jgi:hypothetical protein
MQQSRDVQVALSSNARFNGVLHAFPFESSLRLGVAT